MKKYIVRLHNADGAIVDGEIFSACNEKYALLMYKIRCKNLGIGKYPTDYYTVTEVQNNDL